MKNLLFLGFGLALLTSPLSAQTPPPSTSTDATDSTDTGKHHKHHHPDFLKQLNLTDIQKSEIEKIKQSGGTKKEKHAAIKAVLNTEQLAKLKQLKAAWKAAHPKHEGEATT